jgi:glycosyltransferase involved in cell wall biosynthesis
MPDHSFVVTVTGQISPVAREQRTRVSLVAVVKNESAGVEEWFEHILAQTRLPDEIIIVDGCSTDGTKQKLDQFLSKCPVPLRVLSEPGGNIARNRNIAVSAAQYPLIAVTDFGCYPKPRWLEKITLPFELDDQVQVCAGVYEPVNQRRGQPARLKALWYWSRLSQVNPQKYLPPGGSIAYRKTAWQAVGGYAEWLTLTGEDTYFDLELKHYGGKWAFVPEAVVEWAAPDTLPGYLKKVYGWAIGDGESGIHARYFLRYAARLAALAVGLLLLFAALITLWINLNIQAIPWIVLICAASLSGLALFNWKFRFGAILAMGEAAQLCGFLRGAARRKQVNLRRFAGLKGAFFIFAGVPIDDTGGGSRGTQLTAALLRQGYAVVYIHKYPKYESVELNLGFAHPNLFVFSASHFNCDRFFAEHEQWLSQKEITGIVQFPHAGFLPWVRSIRSQGGHIVYDLLDDWRTSLGSLWYSAEAETEIIHQADILVATAPRLQSRLEAVSGRAAALISNAVNDRLFNPHIERPRPADMPRGDWCLLYSGALWGDWFDWELLNDLAQRYPQAAVCVIGDHRGGRADLAPNIHLLGLKAQAELPAYFQHADVAIIPWKDCPITQATSPLKLYEYLAMRLPVVAPDLPAIRGIPGVLLAKDRADFLALLEQARTGGKLAAGIDDFIERNNWSARLAELLALIQAQRLSGPAPVSSLTVDEVSQVRSERF